jgi:integrase
MEQRMLTTLNFNLRSGEGKRIIYAVVYDGNRQEKISIGEKVYKDLWDGKRQMCRINKDLSESAINEQMRINQKINDVKILFSQIFCVQLHGESANIVGFLKEKIESMGNEKNLVAGGKYKATLFMEKAFKVYAADKSRSEGTVKTYGDKVRVFINYIIDSGTDGMSHITEKGIIKFRDFLIKQGKSHKTINNYIDTLTYIINGVRQESSDFDKYGLQEIRIKRLKEKVRKQEDMLRTPLTDEEVKKLSDVKGLKPQEKEYRDLFIFQCGVGCRVSDLWRFFDETAHRIEKGKENSYVVYDTRKEEITGYCIQSPQIEKVMNEGFKYIKVEDSKKFRDGYNKALKKAAKMAGLDRVIKWKDPDGNNRKDALHKVLTCHFARHTFATKMLLMGYEPQEVCKMTAHADDKMVNHIYGHISDYATIKKLDEATERIKGQKSPDNDINKVHEYKDVLAFYGCPWKEYKDMKDPEELLRLIVRKYETELEKEGLKHTILKAIYNGDYKDMEERNRMEKILTTINEINGKK